MPRKIGARLTDEHRKNISLGQKKRHAERPESTYRKVDSIDSMDIVELYNSGTMRVKDICAMYNISMPTFYTLVNCIEGVDYDK